MAEETQKQKDYKLICEAVEQAQKEFTIANICMAHAGGYHMPQIEENFRIAHFRIGMLVAVKRNMERI